MGDLVLHHHIKCADKINHIRIRGTSHASTLTYHADKTRDVCELADLSETLGATYIRNERRCGVRNESKEMCHTLAEGELLIMAVRTRMACTVMQSEPFSQTYTCKRAKFTHHLVDNLHIISYIKLVHPRIHILSLFPTP